MGDFEKVFGDKAVKDNAQLSTERLVFSVQVALQQSMHRNCISQKVLAERLGISAARVSQILVGDQANLTLKTIAKIAHALGESFELVTEAEKMRATKAKRENCDCRAISVKANRSKATWQDASANDNRFPYPIAA